MGELFTAPHLLILGVIVLVLFGGKKLPELGKGLGEGLRGFKDGMKGMTEEESEDKKKQEEAEAKAYKEAKIAADAKLAAEKRLQREMEEQAGASAHLVTPKPEEVAK